MPNPLVNECAKAVFPSKVRNVQKAHPFLPCERRGKRETSHSVTRRRKIITAQIIISVICNLQTTHCLRREDLCTGYNKKIGNQNTCAVMLSCPHHLMIRLRCKNTCLCKKKKTHYLPGEIL